jgi:hypothetical protein
VLQTFPHDRSALAPKASAQQPCFINSRRAVSGPPFTALAGSDGRNLAMKQRQEGYTASQDHGSEAVQTTWLVMPCNTGEAADTVPSSQVASEPTSPITDRLRQRVEGEIDPFTAPVSSEIARSPIRVNRSAGFWITATARVTAGTRGRRNHCSTGAGRGAVRRDAALLGHSLDSLEDALSVFETAY